MVTTGAHVAVPLETLDALQGLPFGRLFSRERARVPRRHSARFCLRLRFALLKMVVSPRFRVTSAVGFVLLTHPATASMAHLLASLAGLSLGSISEYGGLASTAIRFFHCLGPAGIIHSDSDKGMISESLLPWNALAHHRCLPDARPSHQAGTHTLPWPRSKAGQP